MVTPNSQSASRQKKPLNYCYGLNVCAPPCHPHTNFICWSLIPSAMVLGTVAFRRWLGLDVVMLVGPWSDGISALIGRDTGEQVRPPFSLHISLSLAPCFSLSSMWRHNEKVPGCKPVSFSGTSVLRQLIIKTSYQCLLSAWNNHCYQAAILINLIPSSEKYNYTAALELQKIECFSLLRQYSQGKSPSYTGRVSDTQRINSHVCLISFTSDVSFIFQITWS